MEYILNLLKLDEAEKAAFTELAGDSVQVFAPGGAELTATDYEKATIIFGYAPADMVKLASHLRWLHSGSAGVDNYLAPGVLREGALLSCSVGAYGHTVSEHMFAVMLAIMKRLPAYRDAQANSAWQDLGSAKTPEGARVLICGTGDLGSSFAGLCKALGSETIGVRRDPSKGAAGIDRMYSFAELDGLLPDADVVASFLPHSDDTVKLFDRRRLLLMKDDAILINGGRGTVIDCDALAEVMAEGHLFGAGLDVTAPEPLPKEHPLWKQPRAVITPHVAGGDHIPDTAHKIAAIALENFRHYLNGEKLRNRMK